MTARVDRTPPLSSALSFIIICSIAFLENTEKTRNFHFLPTARASRTALRTPTNVELQAGRTARPGRAGAAGGRLGDPIRSASRNSARTGGWWRRGGLCDPARGAGLGANGAHSGDGDDAPAHAEPHRSAWRLRLLCVASSSPARPAQRRRCSRLSHTCCPSPAPRRHHRPVRRRAALDPSTLTAANRSDGTALPPSRCAPRAAASAGRGARRRSARPRARLHDVGHRSGDWRCALLSRRGSTV